MKRCLVSLSLFCSCMVLYRKVINSSPKDHEVVKRDGFMYMNGSWREVVEDGYDQNTL